MPRPKKEGAAPKTRSRFGCWPCKARKVKCGEEKPVCKNCQRQGETCDYSIRLNWAGRSKNKSEDFTFQSTMSLPSTPNTIVFPSPEVFSGTTSSASTPRNFIGVQPKGRHSRSRSNLAKPADRWASENTKATTPPEKVTSMIKSNDSADMPIMVGQDSRFLNTGWPFSANSLPPENTGLQDGVVDMPASAPLVPLPAAHMATDDIYGPHLNSDPGDGAMAGGSKRLRLNLEGDSSAVAANSLPYESPQDTLIHSPIKIVRSPDIRFVGPTPFSGTPQTPGSIASDDQFSRGLWRFAPSQTFTQDDGRRGSVPVSSLLIDSPTEKQDSLDTKRIPVKEGVSTFYGYDKGSPDQDIPDNDDMSAIVGSPSVTMSLADGMHGQTVAMAFEPGGYYARPVPIKIPKPLLPLPSQLLSNQMNLLYFHHFLNHTARILTPHDCPMNPYRTVLPQMAVRDDNLLNLLLAYSASHRARLLKQPDPETRIARWVQDVFPRLRSSLANPEHISINNIATSVMLASLEIISPSAFGVDIRWHLHLAFTREMLIARSNRTGVTFSDQTFFLARWFGYLDILGGMSGPKPSPPLHLNFYWVNEPTEPDGTIDCVLGCTRPCMRLLAQVSQLVKEAQPFRLDGNLKVRRSWTPSLDIAQQAQNLLLSLHRSRTSPVTTCPHGEMKDSESEDLSVDLREIISTNQLFHWAGIIQLLRRVLNYDRESDEVSQAVHEVLISLETIRDGSPAEACLIFPIFSAACESTSPGQRDRFNRRMADIEEFGMKQVIQAKELMQRTWRHDVPWEDLVQHEEFIG